MALRWYLYIIVTALSAVVVEVAVAVAVAVAVPVVPVEVGILHFKPYSQLQMLTKIISNLEVIIIPCLL